jgi:hypothetical protein
MYLIMFKKTSRSYKRWLIDLLKLGLSKTRLLLNPRANKSTDLTNLEVLNLNKSKVSFLLKLKEMEEDNHLMEVE